VGHPQSKSQTRSKASDAHRAGRPTANRRTDVSTAWSQISQRKRADYLGLDLAQIPPAQSCSRPHLHRRARPCRAARASLRVPLAAEIAHTRAPIDPHRESAPPATRPMRSHSAARCARPAVFPAVRPGTPSVQQTGRSITGFPFFLEQRPCRLDRPPPLSPGHKLHPIALQCLLPLRRQRLGCIVGQPPDPPHHPVTTRAELHLHTAEIAADGRWASSSTREPRQFATGRPGIHRTHHRLQELAALGIVVCSASPGPSANGDEFPGRAPGFFIGCAAAAILDDQICCPTAGQTSCS